MNKQSFYKEIKENWKKILPFLNLPKEYHICEIENNFYVFKNKEDVEYAKNLLGGEFSSYSSMALLCIAGEPYNEGTRLLILVATKVITNWKNNPALRNKALIGTFGHLTKGVDAFEHFNENLPNRYGLILNEPIKI